MKPNSLNPQCQAEWLLESQKDVQLLPGPESGTEHPNDNWLRGDGRLEPGVPGKTDPTWYGDVVEE